MVERFTLLFFFRCHLQRGGRRVVVEFIHMLPFTITKDIFVRDKHPALITANISILTIGAIRVTFKVLKLLLDLLSGFVAGIMRRVVFYRSVGPAMHDRLRQGLS
ncbi:MAG: hypothetical protein CVU33_07080 [Betaproteobacteria bacterium HGW-Betaproteobacteria-6]|nr:MAG: hypothetical protein CVU33_07080 [Betaproteobacteria bacterium HGW-Betaproteobacteria-6]